MSARFTDALWRTVARHLANRPRVLHWLQRRAVPYYHIHGRDGSLYMRRWWLLPRCCLHFDSRLGHPVPKAWMPFSIRLHHIVRPDADRHLHDHPFSFRTLVLKGAYAEQSIDKGNRIVTQSQTYHSPANRWHRIAMVSQDGVWTLFIMGRRKQDWGFLVDEKKVPWREYLGEEGQA